MSRRLRHNLKIIMSKKKHIFSIRTKLMTFVIGLCALLIGLVWFINVPLLEPLYHRQIKTDLSRITSTVVDLIGKYGDIEYYNAEGVLQTSAEFETEINSLNLPLSGKCIDISGSSNLHVMGYEGLQEHCLLHPIKDKNIFGMSKQAKYWDSGLALALRAETQRTGIIVTTLNSERPGVSQLVVSQKAGNYTVTVSTDLERVGEASKIFRNQLQGVGLLLIIISIIGAYFFSRWFSKPLTQMSKAAREVARGNYNVNVDVKGKDELAELCDDFNKMTKEVSRTSQLQSDLIANISHDLRTPLTLIKGYAETVRDLTGEIPQKRTEQLSVIVDETDRLSGLVNSVMELSRISSGAQQPVLVKFDLSQLCEEIAYRYTDICHKNDYTLDVATNCECVVSADPDQLSRVLHNLLSNALHHVGNDGYIALRVIKSDKLARVEIEDHGEGISEDDLPYIFDRYYRTRASEGKVGTGLGLSITKAVLQNHNFAYGVTSMIGSGTKFWFEINLQ